MKNDIYKDNILSANDVSKLRIAYKNYKIFEEYIKDDVNNIMMHEKLNKDQAIKRILKIINFN